VSVEYRLAPETAYPGPLDDCYAGLRWTLEHAEELGIAPDRIGISGVSAGGGLAAALALLARDRAEVPVAFQLLECPMIDDRQTTSSSQLDGLPIWSREANEFGWRSYLGDLYGGDVPAYAAAAHATDLSGLPPALVIVGGADGFRDEDIEYALRLNQAGVPTELHVLPGAPHGVQMFTDSVVARRWNRMVTEWLEQRLR
jgi:acetyl esterase/lipase